MPIAGSAETAYQELRRLLVRGEYKPGDRLLEERLSEQLGVSRTPIREALGRLQSDGLVVPVRRGAVVAQLSVEEVRDLYHYRGALEALAAELAAERNGRGEIPPADIKRMVQARQAVQDAEERGDAVAIASRNLEFHRYIAELSGNPFVVEALSKVWDHIAIYSAANVTDPVWAHEINRHHVKLTDAVIAGDARVAADVARQHIRDAAQIYDTAHTEE
ncbi:MAG TPA: GntR family transcriptional regulator [Gryllotalpicola sp.]